MVLLCKCGGACNGQGLILRVPDQNGISQACDIVEIDILVQNPQFAFPAKSLIEKHQQLSYITFSASVSRLVRGRNSSLVVLGLAVHSVVGSILLWGNFPVEGIFPLELT